METDERDLQDEAPAKVRRLEPLGDRVIVEVVKDEEMTDSGIVIPDSARERSQRGRVKAVGPGRFEGGERVPMGINVGDLLLFSKFGGTELPEGLTDQIRGEAPTLVLREGDILAIEHWDDPAGDFAVFAEEGQRTEAVPTPERPDPLRAE